MRQPEGSRQEGARSFLDAKIKQGLDKESGAPYDKRSPEVVKVRGCNSSVILLTALRGRARGRNVCALGCVGIGCAAAVQLSNNRPEWIRLRDDDAKSRPAKSRTSAHRHASRENLQNRGFGLPFQA